MAYRKGRVGKRTRQNLQTTDLTLNRSDAAHSENEQGDAEENNSRRIIRDWAVACGACTGIHPTAVTARDALNMSGGYKWPVAAGRRAEEVEITGLKSVDAGDR